MSTGKMKILVVMVLVILNIAAVAKLGGAMSSESSENKELETALSTARDYKNKDLCNAALQYYRKSLEKEDRLEIRKEMTETYDKGLENGEVGSQKVIDDFLLATVDERWKDAATYEFALDYFQKQNNEEMLVAVVNRASENRISSETIKKYYNELSRKCSISALRFSSVRYSDNNWFCVSDGLKYGYINQNGETVADFQYEYATPFFDGYALMKKEDYTFLADTNFVRWRYMNDSISSSSGLGNGTLSGEENGKYIYYFSGDKKSEEYDYAGKFQNGIAAVKKGEQWGLLNSEGKEISKNSYKEIAVNNREECVNNGVIFVKDEKWHILNTELEVIKDLDCEEVDIAPNGELFAFKKNGKWGFADYQGNIKISPQYEDARAFSYGYGGAKKNGKWGFVDKDNVYQMEGEYEDVLYFTDSKTCFVKIDGLWTIISKLL